MKENDTFERSFVVTDKIYGLFIDAFEDKNPLHVDEGFAKAHSFEGRVMHGAILTGFLSYFIGECLPVKNIIVQSYKINFVKPVYMNDALKFTATITGVFESVNTIEFKYQFKNEVSKTVAKGDIAISLI